MCYNHLFIYVPQELVDTFWQFYFINSLTNL